MIEQTTFSQLVKDYLAQEFPDFLPSIKYFPDNSFDCILRNPSDIFSILISTENSEITIGIEDPIGNSDIHTHISCYHLEDIDDCLNRLSKIIKDVQNENLILYQDEKGKYDWINAADFPKEKNTVRFSWK